MRRLSTAAAAMTERNSDKEFRKFSGAAEGTLRYYSLKVRREDP
jgi:hypothetical protein